jgi:hypothetical protein
MKLFPDPDCLPGYETVRIPVALRYGAHSEPYEIHLSGVSGRKPGRSPKSPFPIRLHTVKNLLFPFLFPFLMLRFLFEYALIVSIRQD